MNFKYIAAFISGGAIGAAVAWYFTKNKYEQFSADDRKEIDELRTMYRNKMAELSSKNMKKPDISDVSNPSIEEKPERDPELLKYDKVLYETKYKYRDKYSLQEEGGEQMEYTEPIAIIDPDEYASYNGYDKRNLVLYKDDILADELTDDITLIEDSIGQEAVDILKNERPEAIYVRNELEQAEYEVTWDNRTYGEVTGIYIKDED